MSNPETNMSDSSEHTSIADQMYGLGTESGSSDKPHIELPRIGSARSLMSNPETNVRDSSEHTSIAVQVYGLGTESVRSAKPRARLPYTWPRLSNFWHRRVRHNSGEIFHSTRRKDAAEKGKKLGVHDARRIRHRRACRTNEKAVLSFDMCRYQLHRGEISFSQLESICFECCSGHAGSEQIVLRMPDYLLTPLLDKRIDGALGQLLWGALHQWKLSVLMSRQRNVAIVEMRTHRAHVSFQFCIFYFIHVTRLYNQFSLSQCTAHVRHIMRKIQPNLRTLLTHFERQPPELAKLSTAQCLCQNQKRWLEQNVQVRRSEYGEIISLDDMDANLRMFQQLSRSSNNSEFERALIANIDEYFVRMRRHLIVSELKCRDKQYTKQRNNRNY